MEIIKSNERQLNPQHFQVQDQFGKGSFSSSWFVADFKTPNHRTPISLQQQNNEWGCGTGSSEMELKAAVPLEIGIKWN